MKFTFFHNNINVLDLDKSVEFYKKALGLEVTKEFHAPDGSIKLVNLGDGTTPQTQELTTLHDNHRPKQHAQNTTQQPREYLLVDKGLRDSVCDSRAFAK